MIHLAHTKRDQDDNWRHVTLDLEQSPTKVRNSRTNFRNKHSQKVLKRNEAFLIQEAVGHKTNVRHGRQETQKEVRLKEVSHKLDSQSRIKGVNLNFGQYLNDIYDHHDIIIATFFNLNSPSTPEIECSLKKAERLRRSKEQLPFYI